MMNDCITKIWSTFKLIKGLTSDMIWKAAAVNSVVNITEKLFPESKFDSHCEFIEYNLILS